MHLPNHEFLIISCIKARCFTLKTCLKVFNGSITVCPGNNDSQISTQLLLCQNIKILMKPSDGHEI